MGFHEDRKNQQALEYADIRQKSDVRNVIAEVEKLEQLSEMIEKRMDNQYNLDDEKLRLLETFTRVSSALVALRATPEYRSVVPAPEPASGLNSRGISLSEGPLR